MIETEIVYIPPNPKENEEFIRINFEKGLFNPLEQLMILQVARDFMGLLIDHKIDVDADASNKSQMDIRFNRDEANKIKSLYFTTNIRITYPKDSK